MIQSDYGSMLFVARANLNALRHCGSQAELNAKGLRFTGWLRELNLLIVADELGNQIQTGDIISLQGHQHALMVTGTPTHDFGVRRVPVTRVNAYGVLLRSAGAPRNGIGRPASNLETVQNCLPVICRSESQFYVSPGFAVRQGDLIEVDELRYTVLGVRLPDSQRLLQLCVAKQT